MGEREDREVIEAAVQYVSGGSWDDLAAAVRAREAAMRPKFEAWIGNRHNSDSNEWCAGVKRATTPFAHHKYASAYFHGPDAAANEREARAWAEKMNGVPNNEEKESGWRAHPSYPHAILGPDGAELTCVTSRGVRWGHDDKLAAKVLAVLKRHWRE